MNLGHLVFREIAHRRGSFLVGLASVIAAVGCLVGSLLALEGHDLRTRERLLKLDDAARKITKELGFNVLIVPKDQDLGKLYADDYASHYMPEAYCTKLAESPIITVNHLLPSLQQKLIWPEEKRTVILIGTRGEIPILHRDPKKPLIEAVERGTVVLGYELHNSLGLLDGSRITILEKEFVVARRHDERGSKDDITIWMHLAEVQELLDKKGLINVIRALECHCATDDRIGSIRREVGAILPDTRVVELASQAKARADIRNRTAAELRAARGEQEAFASVLVPLVLLGSSIWVGLLALGNVRDRAAEVGILRALGLGAKDILWVFLGKAAVMGLCGAALGYAAGIVVGALWGDIPLDPQGAVALFDPLLLVAVLFAAPLVAMLASWIPALIAAQQDPAVVLRRD